MHIQAENIFIHFFTSIFRLICVYMRLCKCIYAYIGVYWLAFGLLIHHYSPWLGESPMTPRELRKIEKCKYNVGQTL